MKMIKQYYEFVRFVLNRKDILWKEFERNQKHQVLMNDVITSINTLDEKLKFEGKSLSDLDDKMNPYKFVGTIDRKLLHEAASNADIEVKAK
jgi:hypothetical protein